MRLFKGFFIVLAGMFIFITVISLFIPSRLMITRAVVINAGKQGIFSEISNLQNWKHWQPVFMNDSARMHCTRGINGITDHCEWESKGKKNSLTISIQNENSVSAILARTGEPVVQNTINVLPLANSNQVQVEWNALMKLRWYPWEKFYGLFIEKVSGQGYEDALNSLKNYMETRQ